MTNSKSTIWQRSPHVAFVDDGERVVLLSLNNPRNSQPRLLTDTAADIWRAIAASSSMADMVDAIFGERTTPENVQAGIANFLNQLLQEGFVRTSPSSR